MNVAPSFTKGANETSLEDAGLQTVVGWATAINPGPGEGAQIVTFIVNNDNNTLFSSQPAVASNGTLTYTAAPNANGSATVTVQAHDDGGPRRQRYVGASNVHDHDHRGQRCAELHQGPGCDGARRQRPQYRERMGDSAQRRTER